MTTRQWLALLCLFFSYVWLGTAVFYTIEHNLETQRRSDALQARIHINGKKIILRLEYLDYSKCIAL